MTNGIHGPWQYRIAWVGFSPTMLLKAAGTRPRSRGIGAEGEADADPAATATAEPEPPGMSRASNRIAWHAVGRARARQSPVAN